MKKLRYFILAILVLSSGLSFGSHAVGMRITYEHISGSNYLFNLKLYRDCSGISAPTAPQLCFSGGTGCAPSFNATLTMDLLNSGFEVPFNSCNGTGPTFCSGGSIFAFEEYNYNAVVSVPPCSNWIVSYSLCCRNAAITNLINPDTYNGYVETTFDNLNFPGNSSPQFNAVPLNYYCAGIASVVDYSAYDVDGDSLSYEFTNIQGGINCNSNVIINYAPPYTYTQPLATLVPTVFDPVNGMISFTPSALQISVIGFKVNEYRNGVLIGSVRRDDEVVVVGGFTNPDTITGRVYYDTNSNGLFDGGDIPGNGIVLHLGPGNTYTSAATNGKYEFFTNANVFDISIPNLPLYTTVTPPSITVNTVGGGYFYPNNDFILQPIPNQNDLSVNLNNLVNATPGLSYPLTINYQNEGTVLQNNVDVVLNLDPKMQFISASPIPTSIAGNVITWNFPSLTMFASGTIAIQTVVDSTAQMGALVYSSASISSALTDLTPANNFDFVSGAIRAPFDPNMKENTPSGDVDLTFVTSQQWMYYKVYFQNLGTAPAQTVRIIDLIDFDLDPGSIELVGYSKPCAMILTSPNRLEFNFYGINLPAASVNEPASHGFVEFRIKPKSTLNVGALITNNASIIFDFNPPIYTNLVHNKVVMPTSVTEIPTASSLLSVYPSPAKDFVTIQFLSNESKIVELQFTNLLGSTIATKKLELVKGDNKFEFPVSEFSNGVYFVTIPGYEKAQAAKFTVVRD